MNNRSSIGSESATDNELDGFSRRIQQVIATQGISQNEFARRLGSTTAFVSNVVRGKSKPGLEFIHKIAGVFQVSLDWLVMGKGSMYGDPPFDKEWFNVLTLRAALVSIASRGDQEAEQLLAELLGEAPKCTKVTDQRQMLLDQVSKISAFSNFVGDMYKNFPRKPTDPDHLAQITRELRKEAEKEALMNMVNFRI